MEGKRYQVAGNFLFSNCLAHEKWVQCDFVLNRDPVDVLILNDVPLITGCLARVELLAVVNAEQTEGGKTFRNDRLIAILVDEESPPEFLRFQLDERSIAQIQYFFATYNRFSGKDFKVLGTGDGNEAKERLREGERRFKQKNKNG